MPGGCGADGSHHARHGWDRDHPGVQANSFQCKNHCDVGWWLGWHEKLSKSGQTVGCGRYVDQTIRKRNCGCNGGTSLQQDVVSDAFEPRMNPTSPIDELRATKGWRESARISDQNKPGCHK